MMEVSRVNKPAGQRYVPWRPAVAAPPRWIEPYADVDPEDPFERASLAAPRDDEPFTKRQRQRAGSAWREYLRGEARPLADVRRELLADEEVDRSAPA